MTRKGQPGTEIPHLRYQPGGSYKLDLEIFFVSDLRRRFGTPVLSSTHRYAFPTLIFVSEGECIHVVDFESLHCQPGSLLVLPPGKAHSFGAKENWDGWMVLFRSEFLWTSSSTAPDLTALGGLDGLPVHLTVGDGEIRAITNAIAQMHEDAGISAALQHAHALLRHQLYALLMRIRIIHERQAVQAAPLSRVFQRFKDFEQLLEKNFAHWHQIAKYADQLACSEKSLARASMEVAGVNPKVLISARVILEAKRMLAHTGLSVSRISEDIGFNDLANFVKFFKREAGCTPMEFRRQQTLSDAAFGTQG